MQSWFMDLSLVQKYWNQQGQAARTYHHTAPVNQLYGLHEALVMYLEEGEQEVWQRHREMAVLLQQGLRHLGYEYLVAERWQMPQLHVVIPPAHILAKEAEMRQQLLKHELIEIGGGLGDLAGKVCVSV